MPYGLAVVVPLYIRGTSLLLPLSGEKGTAVFVGIDSGLTTRVGTIYVWQNGLHHVLYVGITFLLFHCVTENHLQIER